MRTNPAKIDLANAIAIEHAARQGSGRTMSDALHVFPAISMAGPAVVPPGTDRRNAERRCPGRGRLHAGPLQGLARHPRRRRITLLNRGAAE